MYHYVFIYDGKDMFYVWDAEEYEALGVKEESNTKEDIELIQALLGDNPPDKFIVNYSAQYGLLGTAWVPLYNSSRVPVAIVGVDLYMPGIFKTILMFALVVAVGVVIVTALGGFIYHRSITRGIIHPIELLNRASSELVNNIDKDVEFIVDIHTGDELEDLADSFRRMDLDLRNYIHELEHVTAEKERIGAELSLATNIQASSLPHIIPAFPARGDYEIYADMNPAKEVGGDFYDYFLIDDHRLCILIADVSGKGVPAALFMMTAKTMIKDYGLTHDSTAEILTAVNARLCENNDAGMFATAWIGILDTRTRKIQYTNAGHNYPVLKRRGQPCEMLLKVHGLFLAGLEFTQYKQSEIQLEMGDRLLLYTDGVVEAHNRSDELYGEERLQKIVDDTCDLPGKEAMERIFADVSDYATGVPQFDDITMVVLTVVE